MMMRFNLFLTLLCITIGKIHGQTGYPSPTNKDNLLFYIQHDRGQNTYVYKANLNSAKSFNHRSPITVYRELFDEGGIIKPLTKIQSTFAYGVKNTKVTNNNFQISIVSLPDQTFEISLDKNRRAVAETTVNGKKLIVQRIFLKQTEGTSGMSTKLDYILFFGKSPQGDTVTEKLIL